MKVTEKKLRVRTLDFTMEGQTPYRVVCYPPGHPAIGDATSTEARVERLTRGKSVEGVITIPVEAMSARRADLTELHRQKLRCGVALLQGGKPADICELPRHHGMSFRAGGCLLVVATAGDYCVAGHAGVRSLICLDEDRDGREYESVVHAIVAYFDTKGVASSDILLRGYFGINPDVFPHDPNHSRNGRKYRKILDKLEILQLNAQTKKCWGQSDHIVTTRGDNNLPHVSVYHALKAQAVINGITRVAHEKMLPIDKEFAYTRHPLLGQKRNDVFVYRA